MAVTAVCNANVIHVTNLNADWAWSTTLPARGSGIRVESIQFNPTAASDRCVMLDGASGTTIMDVTCADTTDSRVKYFYGQKLRPVFDFSQSVISGTSTDGHIIIMTR